MPPSTKENFCSFRLENLAQRMPLLRHIKNFLRWKKNSERPYGTVPNFVFYRKSSILIDVLAAR